MRRFTNIFRFDIRRLMLALMVPVLLCLAAAPAFTAQQTRVGDSRSKKDGQDPTDAPIFRTTIDVADIRTECAAGGEQKRGKSRSRVCRTLIGDENNPGYNCYLWPDGSLFGGADSLVCPEGLTPNNLAAAPEMDATLRAGKNACPTSYFAAPQVKSADHADAAWALRDVTLAEAQLDRLVVLSSRALIPANPPTGPPLG